VRVLTVAEIRELDRRAIEETGIPGLVLMENAALAVVDAIGERFPAAARVGILCGPGNNGADGLAVARQLDARGYRVLVLQAALGRRLSADAGAQRRILESLGIAVRDLAADPGAGSLAELANSDVVVDALLGSGLTRPLEGAAARLCEELSALGPPVVAVDLPSGLDGDRGLPFGPHVRAAMTVTFAAPKPALVLPPACDSCGELVVGDLGHRLEEGGGPGALHLLVGEELARAIAPRDADAHKGRFGHVLLVAGSRGKAGAAVLAARASVAGGAGLTTVAAPRELLPALVAACPEAMGVALEGTAEGTLGEGDVETMLAAAAERTTLAVGPGLGRTPATAAAIRRLVGGTDRPLVLDADGLDAFAGRIEELAARRAPTVLTPHPGELGRLLGRTAAEIQAARLESVREAARRSGAVVVLKGRRTLIASADGETWINDTGNPGMASGGSGDVLTGLLAARLAQQEEASFAACLAVHWHGAAGDLARARRGGPAIPAGGLIAALGEAWEDLARR
jgi:hydroxyethylthiazole kinase-like uncharacterized protein yjeF